MLNNLLHRDAHDFTVVHARTFYGGDIFAEFNQIWAQVTIKFTTGKSTDKYIVMERLLEDDICYLDWKITCLDYDLKI